MDDRKLLDLGKRTELLIRIYLEDHRRFGSEHLVEELMKFYEKLLFEGEKK